MFLLKFYYGRGVYFIIKTINIFIFYSLHYNDYNKEYQFKKKIINFLIN